MNRAKRSKSRAGSNGRGRRKGADPGRTVQPRPTSVRAGGSGRTSAPPSSGFRDRVERLSYPLLVRLHQLPRWVVTGGFIVLLVAGLMAPKPWGPLCLAVVVILMAWLSYLAWPEGDRTRRMLRLVALGLGAGAIVLRVLE